MIVYEPLVHIIYGTVLYYNAAVIDLRESKDLNLLELRFFYNNPPFVIFFSIHDVHQPLKGTC